MSENNEIKEENKSGNESGNESRNESYIIVRENIHLNVDHDFLIKSNMFFDANVYKITSDQHINQVCSNKINFINDSHFIVKSSTIGSNVYDNTSVKLLETYLQENGKIPSFLGVKLDDDNAIRIYTKKPIASSTYIGHFQGISRPVNFINGLWVYPVKNFEGVVSSVIDADNIVFSNWTRYLLLNKSNEPNCTFLNDCNNVFVFTKEFISEGQNLYF